MPKYTPTQDDMDTLYPSPETTAETETETEMESPESVNEEAEEEPSALVPKSALAGCDCTEGQTITMKVVKDYGDEVELALVSKPKESMMSSDEEIDSMDRKEMM